MSWWADDDPDDESELDESDVRTRPNRRGSRPRSKIRPRHEDAVPGRVLGVDRGRYTVLVDGDGDRRATATRARELHRTAIVTGDRVDVVGDTSGAEGTLCRIVRIRDRTTVLRRSADDTDPAERVLVANADRMLIVVAAADPTPRPRLVDRCLAAAYDAGITPMLCLTKTDLADPAPFLARFAGLGLTVVTSRLGAWPIAELRALLARHETVVVGHSGVGKSTLVNALVPGALRATGGVNATTGRGRHTSSSSRAIRLGPGRDDGWIIDTPGVRSFGLAHVLPEAILASFTDLAPYALDCPRGCTHLAGADDCAIAAAVADGRAGAAGAARLESLQRLLAALARPSA